MFSDYYLILMVFFTVCAVGIGFFHLYAGLLILAFFGPFFTILHEISPGSPIFFLWPFLLCSSMLISFLCQESFSKDGCLSRSERQKISLITVGLIVISTLATIWIGKDVQSVLSDTSLNEFRKILTNRNLLVVAVLFSMFVMAFLTTYFIVMKRMEGRWQLLDVVFAILLSYGLFQIFYSGWQAKVFFVGLDGFRYYFFMLLVYFFSRLSFRRSSQTNQFFFIVIITCVLGAAHLLVESFLLNVVEIGPNELPWAGHLEKNFGYSPEGNRAFFQGKFIPLGSMYMTHMSGLYLLLGIAVLMLPLLSLKEWKRFLLYVVPFLIILSATYWTSRTVLILLAFTFVYSAFLLKVSWKRTVLMGVGGMAFILFSSSSLIPGLRYDIKEDVHFVIQRAFPNLFRAFAFDLESSLGIKRDVSKSKSDESPPYWKAMYVDAGDWRKTRYAQSFVRRFADGGKPGKDILMINAIGKEGVILRRVLYGIKGFQGTDIMVGAWLKSESSGLLRVEINGYEKTSLSKNHPGDGSWQFVALKHKLHPFGGKVEINIRSLSDTKRPHISYLNGVYLKNSGKIYTLMTGSLEPPWEKAPKSNGDRGREKSTHKGKTDFTKRPEKSFSRNYYYLVGRGMAFSSWTSVFFPKERASLPVFQVSSYSDFKYLEYFEQFGIVGLVLLLLMGGTAIFQGFLLFRNESDPQSRAIVVSLTLFVIIAFVSMAHLPSLFRVGFNSTVYMAMGILVNKSRQAIFRPPSFSV